MMMMMTPTNMLLRTASRSGALRSVSSVARNALVTQIPASRVAGSSSSSSSSSSSPLAFRKAFFSDSGSHGDFAAQRKTVPDETAEAMKVIKDHITENSIMLYMKGNPGQPMCGFSAKVVQALQTEGADFSSVNVLDYPSIREGVKQYSEWPTIPQLYVNGEFVGGCDIVLQMHESGELAELLKETATTKE